MKRPGSAKKLNEIMFCVDSGCSDHLVNKDDLQGLWKLEIGRYEGEVRGFTKKGVRFEINNFVHRA